MSHAPPSILRAVAFAPGVIGVVVVAVGVLRALGLPGAGRAHVLGEALRLGLDFLLAAGLLRLATLPDVRSLALAAAIVAVRRVVGTGVGFAERALSADPATGAPGRGPPAATP